MTGNGNWWAHPAFQLSPSSFVDFTFDWENVASGAGVAELLQVRAEGSLWWEQHLSFHGVEAFHVHRSWRVQLPLHPSQVSFCGGAIGKACIQLSWRKWSSFDTILPVQVRKLQEIIVEKVYTDQLTTDTDLAYRSPCPLQRPFWVKSLKSHISRQGSEGNWCCLWQSSVSGLVAKMLQRQRGATTQVSLRCQQKFQKNCNIFQH